MGRDYVAEMKTKHAGNLREEAHHLRAKGSKRSIREAEELEAWAAKIERLVDPNGMCTCEEVLGLEHDASCCLCSCHREKP